MTRWWPAEIGRRGFTYPLLATVSFAVESTRENSGFDQSIEKNTKTQVGRHGTGVAHGLTSLGNGTTEAALLGATYLIGRWSHNDRLSETTSLSAEALANAGIWVTALKLVTARTRPSNGGTGDFFQYTTHNGQENGSFPSGHAMGAFAIATVFAHQYADKKWVPWIAYGTASLIAASRVGTGRHFPSDVVAAGILGSSIGRMVIARAHGDALPPPGGRIGPIFDSTGRGYGVGYSYSW